MIDNKKMIIFDLDGTLAPSKGRIDDEMGMLLNILLKEFKVSVITGGDYPQFQKQFLPYITGDGMSFENLYLCPTCGTKMYNYVDGDWNNIYTENLTLEEKSLITNALENAIKDLNLQPTKIYGEIIEDRGTQITYSALGQQAPLNEKENWDPDFSKRSMIKDFIDSQLGDFSVLLGGTTSIDITRKGIDKTYGIKKIREITGINYHEMLFLGDAIFEGGNDYPVKRMGIDCIGVSGIDDTKKFIRIFCNIK